MASIVITRITHFVGHLVFQLIVGISAGVIEVGAVLKLVNIWKNNSGPFLLSVSLAWMTASAIVPLIMVPFLSTKYENFECAFNSTACNSTITITATTSNIFNQTTEPSKMFNMNAVQPETRIWIPYLLLGVSLIVLASIALLFVYIQFMRNRSNQKLHLEEENVMNNGQLKEQAKTEKYYKIACVVLGSILSFIFGGIVDSTSQYWVTFVMFTDLKLSKQYGVFMLSALSISLIASNLVGILVATKVNAFTFLVLLTSFAATGNIILLIFANSSLIMLWVGAITEKIGYSCVYMSVFNYLEQSVGITNTIGSLLVFANWFANSIGYCALIGQYIEQYPMSLIYSNLINIFVVILCLISLFYFEKTMRKVTK
ncbi:sodium-dependent glucose transporter 1-like protein [Leptotrombidium deliense]|uniref:Sodium-dependent glucose transporter 1-like protein n=1 Tax=Leptotrombidium deliense TaxID=299467 RepID=A0A443S3W2_9ACAR|nr:sodium-dependent glucose transporter 1-like protein [Leptotrombidium deliense]